MAKTRKTRRENIELWRFRGGGRRSDQSATIPRQVPEADIEFRRRGGRGRAELLHLRGYSSAAGWERVGAPMYISRIMKFGYPFARRDALSRSLPPRPTIFRLSSLVSFSPPSQPELWPAEGCDYKLAESPTVHGQLIGRGMGFIIKMTSVMSMQLREKWWMIDCYCSKRWIGELRYIRYFGFRLKFHIWKC